MKELTRINKNSFLMLCMSMLMLLMVPFSQVQAESIGNLEAESAILIDAETGKVLYEKNADIALPTASMVKIMTELLVWEAIEAGDITWETTTHIDDALYTISANPSFSGVGLRQDVDYTVRSLYEAMAINSDNATTMALAQIIGGSEGNFVTLMTEKAEEIGLPDYQFVNSTGLDNVSLGEHYPEGTDANGINYMSARSLAMLANYFVNKYPEALETAKLPETEFDGLTIRNWNWMLPHDASYLEPLYYEGVDGLKTGHTQSAGYGFVGTAEREGNRLISVVMKTTSEEERFIETAKILDYGYNSFETVELFPAGYQLEDQQQVEVAKGKEKVVSIATADAFAFPIKKDEEENYEVIYHLDESKLDEDGSLVAPIEAGEVVGTAEIIYNGEEDYGFIDDNTTLEVVDVVTTDDVEKSNWFMLTLGAIGDFFSQLFSTIVDTITGWFK